MNEQADALRAVVATARSWAHANDPDEAERLSEALQDVVKRLEDLLPKRGAGFVVPRMWGTLIAGNFVRTPNGDWYEVTSSKRVGAQQIVGLRSPDGKKAGDFPRDPDGKVQARIRNKPGDPEEAAFEALSAAFSLEVLDSPPWDES